LPYSGIGDIRWHFFLKIIQKPRTYALTIFEVNQKNCHFSLNLFST